MIRTDHRRPCINRLSIVFTLSTIRSMLYVCGYQCYVMLVYSDCGENCVIIYSYTMVYLLYISGNRFGEGKNAACCGVFDRHEDIRKQQGSRRRIVPAGVVVRLGGMMIRVVPTRDPSSICTLAGSGISKARLSGKLAYLSEHGFQMRRRVLPLANRITEPHEALNLLADRGGWCETSDVRPGYPKGWRRSSCRIP